MALESKHISIGSGSLYITEFDTTIPAATTIETEENRLGDIAGGATVSYSPTYYTATDDMGRVKKTMLTQEDVTFQSGLITWVNDTLAKLVLTGRNVKEEVTPATDPVSYTGKETLSIGGIANYSPKVYVLRFVHADGKRRLTMLCQPQTTLELVFTKDAETSINAEFAAVPMSDGSLLTWEDTTEGGTPS